MIRPLFTVLITMGLSIGPAVAQTFQGKVTSVLNGDTVKAVHDGREEVIHLTGICCPSQKQSFGDKAKQFTSNLCLDQIVTVTKFGQDLQQETIADIVLSDGKVLNAELVKAGLAWYQEDSKRADLKQLEEKARSVHAGLWVDKSPVPPWNFKGSENSITHATNPNQVQQATVETTALQGAATNANQVQQAAIETTPLQGGVAAVGTNSNQVQQAAVQTTALQGGVERIAQLQPNPVPLLGSRQPQSDSLRLARPLEGRVQDAAPLQGRVQDAALQGKVDRNDPILFGARTPSQGAIMRIIQIKLLPNGSPFAQNLNTQSPTESRQPPSAPPLRPRPPARMDHPPVRGQTGDLPPVRAGADQGPPQRLLAQAPSRQAISQAPERSSADIGNQPFRVTTIEEDDYQGLEHGVRRRRVREENLYTNMNPGINTPVSALPTGNPPNIVDPGVSEAELKAKRKADERARKLLEKEMKQKNKDAERLRREQEEEARARPIIRDNPVPLTPAQESLLWDQWYAHLNDLVCRVLARTMGAHGNPAGRCRIHITVWADHRIKPILIQGSNKSFGEAVLQAYQALNGEPTLQFPAGTQRSVVDYESDHIQDVPATPTAFDAQSIRGDRELIKR